MIKSTVIALATLFFSTISLAAPVNINTASISEIADALNGVGSVKAERVVAYRTQNGNFTSAEQIVNVSGIGSKTFEKNKADILVK
ncbi:MAG: helix-hairpin-helix domain-containing protein [Gammaproteobacteria bacterium]|nr:helix-hairpin-helix domain-containing protein [Gammaproteobacteria bacterium]